MTSYDVAIVGAGLSGLACARELLQKQPTCRIVILDARDRVGGRTYSVPFRDDAIDLGGQWVGPSQHRTLAPLREVQLRTVKQLWFDTNDGPPSAPASVAPFVSGAGDVNHSSILLNSGSSVPLTAAEIREMASISDCLESWASIFREPSSWARADAAAWDAISVKTYLDTHVQSLGVRRELDLLVRTVTASEPSDLSFLYFLAFLGMCGGLAAVGDGDGGAQSFKIDGGAQQLAQRLSGQLRARGVHIRLGAAVSRIGWGGSEGGDSAIEVTVTRPVSSTVAGGHGEGGPGVAVPVQASVQIHARKIVLAISPPLWASIAWSPPLPVDKAAVAHSMYMGCAVKTIAVYQTRFWADSPSAAAQDIIPSSDPSAGVVSAPCSPPPAPGGSTLALAAPCYTPGAPESQHRQQQQQQQHLEDLGPVANLFPANVAGSPALIGLVTGAAAVSFAALPDTERRSAVLQQYERYFGSAAAHLECTDFISKDWIHEPYSRGCFAALMPPGLAASGGGASARKPLCSCRAGAGGVCGGCGDCGGGLVFFAGTELAGEWAGYFEGAIEAGYRAAGEVATALLLLDRQPSRSRL